MSLLSSLSEKVSACVRLGGTPVVVFDIDSTLIDTATRQLVILQRFASEHPETELSRVVAELTTDDMGWDVRTPLRERGLTDQAILRQLLDFWADRFFHEDYADVDQPAPGAVPFVTQLAANGAVIYYLTGRVAPDVGDATIRLLRRHGFPILDGTAILHMKPTGEAGDGAFKVDAVRQLGQKPWTVLATFENEAMHTNHFAVAFPDAQHFLVGDVHSPDAPEPLASVGQIADFRDAPGALKVG